MRRCYGTNDSNLFRRGPVHPHLCDREGGVVHEGEAEADGVTRALSVFIFPGTIAYSLL